MAAVSETCEMDGYEEDHWGREFYWHCEDDAFAVVDGLWLCRRHFAESEEDDTPERDHDWERKRDIEDRMMRGGEP